MPFSDASREEVTWPLSLTTTLLKLSSIAAAISTSLQQWRQNRSNTTKFPFLEINLAYIDCTENVERRESWRCFIFRDLPVKGTNSLMGYYNLNFRMEKDTWSEMTVHSKKLPYVHKERCATLFLLWNFLLCNIAGFI